MGDMMGKIVWTEDAGTHVMHDGNDDRCRQEFEAKRRQGELDGTVKSAMLYDKYGICIESWVPKW